MLQDFFKLRNEEIAEKATAKEITCKFIPPATPHFGGLWERGVRSMKEHLKKTLRSTPITFVEYEIVLCRIEACLNLRPLCPIIDDMESLDALMPGPFLIGNALLAPPNPKQSNLIM